MSRQYTKRGYIKRITRVTLSVLATTTQQFLPGRSYLGAQRQFARTIGWIMQSSTAGVHDMTHDIFIARQPIVDQNGETFGYELFYRDGPSKTTFFDDPDRATLAVIERAYLHWGMERLLGDRFGFINADASLVVNGLHNALPPEGIIFELRENSLYDQPTIDALDRARREGYHFALDNVRTIHQLESSRALALCSMVKIEVSVIGDDEILSMVEYLRRVQPSTLIVAEKIETQSQHSRCTVLGFDLFQGYHFAQPDVLRRNARPVNAASVLALLAETQRHDVDICRVEQLVGSDPTLAYQLLAVVNSSAFGLDRRVDSLRHAIVLLGLDQVRHLATLLALSAADGDAEELLTLGATRARFASAITQGTDMQNAAFTVGLLSVTDALYRTTMEELLIDLPMSDEISSALTNGTSRLGFLLELARACESGDLDRLNELWPGPIDDVQRQYADATQWAEQMRAQITAQSLTNAGANVVATDSMFAHAGTCAP